MLEKTRISTAALELSEKYREEYIKFCIENPGFIMHGSTMKAEALRKASFAESMEDLICMKRCYEIEYQALENGVNGFLFNIQALAELLIKLEPVIDSSDFAVIDLRGSTLTKANVEEMIQALNQNKESISPLTLQEESTLREIDFLKLKWSFDEAKASALYEYDYKNNVRQTQDCRMSFNQWLEEKKSKALQLYVKHSDLFL